MKKKSVPTILAVVVGASVALAGGSTISLLPPGYTWGIANCGPGVLQSRASCKVCCRSGAISGALPPSDVAGCSKSCDDAVFLSHRGFSRWLWGWLA